MFNHNCTIVQRVQKCMVHWCMCLAFQQSNLWTTCAAVPPGVRVIPWWIVFEFHNSKTDLVWAPIFTPCPGVPVVSWCARWVESCVGLLLGIHLVHGSWIYIYIYIYGYMRTCAVGKSSPRNVQFSSLPCSHFPLCHVLIKSQSCSSHVVVICRPLSNHVLIMSFKCRPFSSKGFWCKPCFGAKSSVAKACYSSPMCCELLSVKGKGFRAKAFCCKRFLLQKFFSCKRFDSCVAKGIWCEGFVIKKWIKKRRKMLFWYWGRTLGFGKAWGHFFFLICDEINCFHRSSSFAE